MIVLLWTQCIIVKTSCGVNKWACKQKVSNIIYFRRKYVFTSATCHSPVVHALLTYFRVFAWHSFRFKGSHRAKSKATHNLRPSSDKMAVQSGPVFSMASNNTKGYCVLLMWDDLQLWKRERWRWHFMVPPLLTVAGTHGDKSDGTHEDSEIVVNHSYALLVTGFIHTSDMVDTNAKKLRLPLKTRPRFRPESRIRRLRLICSLRSKMLVEETL